MDRKVAIVTGAGRGIGHACALRFLSESWNVVAAEQERKFKKNFTEGPSRLLFVETDVQEEKSVEKMIKEAVSQFGRIDVLINNAGILPDDETPIEKLKLKEWEKFINTNLTGCFLCAKHAIPYLRKQKGSIVNIASTKALQSEAHTEPYSASKGGVVALSHALAISLGPSIRVNCISPGWIDTEGAPVPKKAHKQHPVGRAGVGEDVAAMAYFLISDEANFITGQNFIVDGGMTKKMIYEG